MLNQSLKNIRNILIITTSHALTAVEAVEAAAMTLA